jgi:hypothetical protein
MEDKDMYTLRDDRGVMRLKLAEDAVRSLVNDMPGHWRKYKSTEGAASVAFEVGDDMVVSLALPVFENGSPAVGKGKMYFWKGDLIIAPAHRVGVARFLPILP